MMKRIFIFLLMCVSVFMAEAQKKKELTTPVNISYCLPKVMYNIEITMECAYDIPGPYQHLAEQELRLKPQITEAKERWTIKQMEIKPQYAPDAVFSIVATNEYTPVTLSLSAEGFLAGVVKGGESSAFNGLEAIKYLATTRENKEEINIINLSTYNHLKEVLDSNYTFQEVDGEMRKIWDPIVRYVPKNESDNVKEAVSEIIRIRSERVRLLSAENNLPDGKSLEILLKEYDQMEANYLSLFMGKTIRREIKKVVSCCPLKADEQVVAFRFTENEGVVDVKDVSGIPYFLKVVEVVVPVSNVQGGEEGMAIHYRVPAVGKLQLLKGKEVLMEMPTIVPQLGEIKRFPLDVISNEGLCLEFYPQFGSLKSVQKITK